MNNGSGTAAGAAKARGASAPITLIDDAFAEALAALRASRDQLREPLLEAAALLSDCFAAGSKVLVCGNGGSAADAQHFAAELVGRFRDGDRPALPALALTADTAVLTAWSNDVGYDEVFARQVEAFGRPGDVLLAISTSGQSPNVVAALEAAGRQGLTRVGLFGGRGGRAGRLVDIGLVVPAHDTARIQEVHILLLHMLCELVEEAARPAERIAAEENGRYPATVSVPR